MNNTTMTGPSDLHVTATDCHRPDLCLHHKKHSTTGSSGAATPCLSSPTEHLRSLSLIANDAYCSLLLVTGITVQAIALTSVANSLVYCISVHYNIADGHASSTIF